MKAPDITSDYGLQVICTSGVLQDVTTVIDHLKDVAPQLDQPAQHTDRWVLIPMDQDQYAHLSATCSLRYVQTVLSSLTGQEFYARFISRRQPVNI